MSHVAPRTQIHVDLATISEADLDRILVAIGDGIIAGRFELSNLDPATLQSAVQQEPKANFLL